MFKNVKQANLKNGKAIQFFLLPAGEGLKTALSLAKKISPLFDGTSELGRTSDAGLLLEVLENFEENEVLALVTKLCNGMSIDGQEVKFDDYFMGNYGELIEILTIVGKENFGSFFTGNGLSFLQ